MYRYSCNQSRSGTLSYLEEDIKISTDFIPSPLFYENIYQNTRQEEL